MNLDFLKGRHTRYLVLSIGLVLASWAFAHQPFWNEASGSPEQAFVIEHLTVSKAIFGNLQAGEVDYFLLNAPAALTLEASLFVGEGCNQNFKPKLFLLRPKTGMNPQTSFEIPKDYSLLQGSGDWTPYKGHGLRGRQGPTLQLEVTSDSYYFVVESGEQGGFYLLSLSGSEAPGGSTEGREAIPRFNQCQ